MIDTIWPGLEWAVALRTRHHRTEGPLTPALS